jgi:ABC-type Fe3+ transport system substrate-binding protein
MPPMLLIDYILSKEGQQILLGADYFPADSAAAIGDAGPIVPKAGRLAGEFRRTGKLTQARNSFGEIFRTLPG